MNDVAYGPLITLACMDASLSEVTLLIFREISSGRCVIPPCVCSGQTM